MRLRDKICIITGGASGIGKAACVMFAREGATVIVADKSLKPAAEVASLAGNGAVAMEMDAADSKSVQRMTKQTVERFGRIDVLVNSTTTGYTPDLLHRTPATDLAPLLAQVALAPMYMTRVVLPLMREQRSGVILNMASDAAKVPTPGETIIGAAMAAIVMFSRTLALEAKRDGIRVNVLTPSLIAGTATAERVQKEGFSAKLFAKAATLAHLGVAEPDDLAALIVFLASPQARRITGQVISVNGGISAG